MSIKADSVIAALKNVMDPDLHKDLVTLNMVKDIKITHTPKSITVITLFSKL